MAAHGDSHANTSSPQMDMPAHLRTWHSFTSLVKWSIGGIALIMIFLALFRTH